MAKPKPKWDTLGRAEQIEEHQISPQNLVLVDGGAVKASDMVPHARSTSALNLKSVLTCLGYYNIDAPGARQNPGEYNNYLINAVKVFQQKQGWVGNSADGLAGPATVQQLARWGAARSKNLHWVQDVQVQAPATVITPSAIRANYERNGWFESSPPNMCLFLSQECTLTPHTSWCANAYWDDNADIRVENDGDPESWPCGAIAIYYGGQYGHAVSILGGGLIVSSDSVINGRCCETNIYQPQEAWNMPLVGYVPHH